jgi:glycosyltransferase involved in cell wall biosynthesis
MKIVHLGHAPLCSGHPDHGRLDSHPGSWVVNLCSAQKASGMDVALITQVPGASANYIDKTRGFPIHFVAAPDRFRALTLFQFDARRLARAALALKPEIAHAHGTEEAYVLAAQATGRPYVVTAQGMLSQINSVMPPRLISRHRVVEFLERRSLAKAQHIIAKSSYVADWISRTYPHLTIHRIPNTFDPHILDVPLDTPREPGSIAFVGTVDPRKGLHLLAEALKTNSVLRDEISALKIFGNSKNPSAYEQSTIRNLKSFLGERLHLRGVLPASEIPQELARCELLVAPSHEEMFGNQVIEALLVGTWPVVSSATAMEENVKRIGAGAVFENCNASNLANTLSQTLKMKGVCNRIEIRRTVNDWMGQEAVSRKHQLLYKMLIIA